MLKGRIPVDENGRPVNHYVVDDTIVANLKSYVSHIYLLHTPNYISLKDIFDIVRTDTTFYFDSDKKIYSITIEFTTNNDSNGFIYIGSKENNLTPNNTYLIKGREVLSYNMGYNTYQLSVYNNRITLYAKKLSDILLCNDTNNEIELFIKYESY
mgnify:CR=1 FL=1